MYLWSPSPGTGKTHLAVAAVRSLIEAGSVGCVLKPQQVFGMMRATYEEGARGTDSEVLERLVRLPVLVLDDMGTARDSDFSVQATFDLIDGRYMRRPTGLVMTSNISPDGLALRWKDGRVASRISELCRGRVFDFTGEPDHRRIG